MKETWGFRGPSVALVGVQTHSCEPRLKEGEFITRRADFVRLTCCPLDLFQPKQSRSPRRSLHFFDFTHFSFAAGFNAFTKHGINHLTTQFFESTHVLFYLFSPSRKSWLRDSTIQTKWWTQCCFLQKLSVQFVLFDKSGARLLF